jgi:hypothetical protein
MKELIMRVRCAFGDEDACKPDVPQHEPTAAEKEQAATRRRQERLFARLRLLETEADITREGVRSDY